MSEERQRCERKEKGERRRERKRDVEERRRERERDWQTEKVSITCSRDSFSKC